MFCPNCGFDMPEGSKFCLSCGNKVPEIQVSQANSKTPKSPDDVTIAESHPAEDHNDNIAIVEAHPQQPDIEEQHVDDMTADVLQPTTDEPPKSSVDENSLGVCNFDDSHRSKKYQPPSPPKKPPMWSTILSVFLAILIFLTAFSATTLSFTREAFTRKNISEWIDNVDLAEVDISMFFNKYSTLSELLGDFLRSQGKWNNLSNRNVERLLEKNSVKSFIEDTLVEYSEFIFEGESGKGLTPDVIIEFVKKNDSSFLSVLNSPLNEERLYFDYPAMEGMLNKNLGNKLSIRAMKNSNPIAVTAIRFLASSSFNTLLWLLCIIFIGLLALLNLKSIRRIFNYLGIPLIILGIFFGILYTVLNVQFMIDTNNIISVIISLFKNGIMKTSLIFLGTGIVLVITKIIIDIIMKKKARKHALE